MPEHLRILLLTPSLPYPPIWGFGIRVYQILKHLSERHEVTLLTYAGPDDADKLGPVREVCHAVHTLMPPFSGPTAKRRAQLLSLVSRESYQRMSLYSGAMQAEIDRLLQSHAFDLVQVESSQMCCFDFHGRAPVVVDEHNIEYELLHRMYRAERSPVRRLYNWREYSKFRAEETRCWHSADGVLMTSQREEEFVRGREPGKPTAVAPNGVDIEYFRPPDASGDPDHLAFSGLISYRPNNDAAVYFVREILPLVLEQRPRAVFTIVGAGAPDEVKRLAGPHVVVTDTVPDVRPYVHEAGVLVVPLRMGSGTRLKVLEGLSMAKPLVSTSLGCEGIDVRHEDHLLVADEPAAFARAVVRLMADREAALAMGLRGRALVEREYSWASVAQRLETFYERLLGNGAGRPAAGDAHSAAGRGAGA